MIRRLAAIFALAMGVLLALAGPASALPSSGGYTPTTAGGTVSDSTPAAGAQFTFCGDGFQPGSTVTFAIDGEVFAIDDNTAEDDGTYCVVGPAPDEAGSYTLTLTGTGANGAPRTVTSTITVLAAGAGSGTGSSAGGFTGGALPRTGSEIGTQLWIAGGLLAFGAGLVALTVVRRREGSLAAA